MTPSPSPTRKDTQMVTVTPVRTLVEQFRTALVRASQNGAGDLPVIVEAVRLYKNHITALKADLKWAEDEAVRMSNLTREFQRRLYKIQED